VCCGVLQCVAVRYSVWQYVAGQARHMLQVCCIVVWCIAVCGNVLQVCCSVVWCVVLQCVALCCRAGTPHIAGVMQCGVV